jgi:hypothetical protein
VWFSSFEEQSRQRATFSVEQETAVGSEIASHTYISWSGNPKHRQDTYILEARIYDNYLAFHAKGWYLKELENNGIEIDSYGTPKITVYEIYEIIE